MAEYIAREVLLAQLRAMESYNASPMYRRGYDDCVEAILKTPAADVVPASQERTYKCLLAALLEDVQSLETTYVDACCMCTKGECDNCNLNTFTDALLKIIERATERKKRLAD
jgi:hypothetical protein|nr:MAG TPA: hypothetical protein [Caudoviricetes sp.]